LKKHEPQGKNLQWCNGDQRPLVHKKKYELQAGSSKKIDLIDTEVVNSELRSIWGGTSNKQYRGGMEKELRHTWKNVK